MAEDDRDSRAILNLAKALEEGALDQDPFVQQYRARRMEEMKAQAKLGSQRLENQILVTHMYWIQYCIEGCVGSECSDCVWFELQLLSNSCYNIYPCVQDQFTFGLLSMLL